MRKCHACSSEVGPVKCSFALSEDSRIHIDSVADTCGSEEYEAREHEDKCADGLEDPEVELVSADLRSDLLE